jgi:hypothetical protein
MSTVPGNFLCVVVLRELVGSDHCSTRYGAATYRRHASMMIFAGVSLPPGHLELPVFAAREDRDEYGHGLA